LIAAELIYGPRHVKNLILTYDSTGNLHAALNISDAQAITTDEQGDIYLLGEDNDPGPRNPKHPLLVELDPTGRIIGSFLDESTFKTGSDAIEDFGPALEMVSASVMVSDGKLYIYAPSERQVLICSLDGKILRRAALEEVAVKIARADKVNRAAISEVAFVDENHVALYLTEHVDPEEPYTLDYSNLHTAIFLIDLTTKSFKLILRGEPGLNPAFVGVKSNQLLTLTRTRQGFEIQQARSVLIRQCRAILSAVDVAEASLARSEGRVIATKQDARRLANDVKRRWRARLTAQHSVGPEIIFSPRRTTQS
jgi:hypothetical protein